MRLLCAIACIHIALLSPRTATAQESGDGSGKTDAQQKSATEQAETKAAEAQLTGTSTADSSPGEDEKPTGQPPKEDPESKDPKATAAKEKPSEDAAKDTDAKDAGEGEAEADDGPEAGHSYHGEAFNDGPRQAAYLMDGVGNVTFPATTDHDLAQQFINQGVAQLHGFWYFEAERSFRQAAAIDPDCAMAYWGMALANANNSKRAKEFIARAVKLKGRVSSRETAYIDALDAWHKSPSGKTTDRAEKYTKALERIIYDHPDDLEARALLGLQLWNNRRYKLKITSHLAVDALLQQVLAKNPMHPCHHYVIHLWDHEKPERALLSSSRCGQAAPMIAHMWHMPGHIYSDLHRYEDAVYQQEASARVDHAHMIRDRILPDQIHNFAHNNEWLIRNLIKLGRVDDAMSLARNMIELPMHPRYNHFGKRGSAGYGRMRLFDVLNTFELWDELIALSETSYLAPTDKESEQVKRLRHIGRAWFRKGDPEQGQAILTQVEALRQEKETARDEAGQKAADEATEQKKSKSQIEKARKSAERKFTATLTSLKNAATELQGHVALAEGRVDEALKLLGDGKDFPAEFKAMVQLQAGKKDDAEKTVRDNVKKKKNETRPLAALVEVLWALEKKEEAKKAFEQLAAISSSVALDAPVFSRLEPIAAELGMDADWRVPYAIPDDVGNRPTLDSLGPFRWHPSRAPEWTLPDVDAKPRSLADYNGKPVVVIFYLGYGCLHCAEQLQAFAPKTEEFAEAGLSVIAISTDQQKELTESQKNYEDGTFPFPLVSDADLKVFKQYRVHDDFENQPLHGTFIIDGDGLIRWQDISYEPFMDTDFVLREARRLLSQGSETRETDSRQIP